MIPRLIQGFTADVEQMSLPVACLRVLRVSPVLATTPHLPRALLDNEAYRHHVRRVAATDHYFYLAHRHYLAQGLSRRQRASLALRHYQHETTCLDDAYFEAVYRGEGLVLWHAEVGGTAYELRLQTGNDVLYEGGLSVVLFVDGGRVAVLSFSYVDRGTIFDDGCDPLGRRGDTIVFVTRKQLAADHAYQKRFNAAFHRCTAAHVVLSALTGVARAQGQASLAAIRSAAHPGYRPDRHACFDAAYAGFWRSVAGRERGRFAYELPLPLGLTPLERLSSKARRRALRRRRHLEEIQLQAERAIREHLLSSH